jgi:hypothetical protein
MTSFKDLGISPNLKAFTGDKIKIDRILNRAITVLDFKIEDSRFTDKGNGKCLYLHITLDGTMHVVFSGSRVLMDMIQKVPRESIPFTTTIVKNNEHLEFT